MKIKKAVALIITLILTLMSSCSNETSQLNRPNSESINKTMLTLWYYWDDENSQKQISELVQRFNKSQENVQIKLEYVPLTEYRKRLSLGMITNDLPDIAMINSASQQYYSQKGMFFDIKEYLEQNVPLELYDNQAMQTCMTRNCIYGIPFGMTVQAMVYNKDILTDAGYNNAPENWNDLKECAEKIKTQNVTPIGFSGLEKEYISMQFLPFLWSAEGDIKAFNSENSLYALTYFSDLFKRGFADTSSINITNADMVSQFKNGEIAIMFTSADKLTSLLNTTVTFQWDIAPIPYDKTAVSIYGGDNIAIINNENSKLSLEFLDYISDDNNIELYSNKLCMLSPRKDILEKQYQNNYIIGKFENIAVNAKRVPVLSRWDDISDTITTSLLNCITNQSTPQDATNSSQTIIDEAYKG